MGILKALGGALLEGLSDEVKRVTGVDIAGEVKARNREAEKVRREQESFAESREAFIEEYGEEAYEEEYAAYEEEIKLIRKFTLEDITCMSYEARENTLDMYRDKLSDLSDRQILHMYRNPNLRDFLKELVEEEIRYRGL